MDINNFSNSDFENNNSENRSEIKDTTLVENLNKCTEELNKQKELYLRTLADFNNFQKRIEKEKLTWLNEGKKLALMFFIPIIDELDLAIKTANKQAENSKEFSSWLEGFKLIQKNFEKRASEFGLEQINTSGEFDPAFHEALMQIESNNHSSGQIVEVFKRGYKFKDEVLSHAKVSVAK